jgi:hypothetical protein
MRISGIHSQNQLTAKDTGSLLWVLTTDESQGVTLIEAKTAEEADEKAIAHIRRSFGEDDASKALFARWQERVESEDTWYQIFPLFGSGTR